MMAHGPNPVSHLKKGLLEHAAPFIYTLLMAAFMLQRQS